MTYTLATRSHVLLIPKRVTIGLSCFFIFFFFFYPTLHFSGFTTALLTAPASRQTIATALLLFTLLVLETATAFFSHTPFFSHAIGLIKCEHDMQN